MAELVPVEKSAVNDDGELARPARVPFLKAVCAAKVVGERPEACMLLFLNSAPTAP